MMTYLIYARIIPVFHVHIYCVGCKYVNKLVNKNNNYQSVPVTGRTPVTCYVAVVGLTTTCLGKKDVSFEEIILNEAVPEPKPLSMLVRPVPLYGKL